MGRAMMTVGLLLLILFSFGAPFTAEAQPAAKGAQDRVFPSGPEREHPSVLPRATRRRICRRSERAYRGPL